MAIPKFFPNDEMVARYSVGNSRAFQDKEDVFKVATEYFEAAEKLEKSLSVSGFCLFAGISRQTFQKYAAGERGDEFEHAFAMVRLIIEEHKLDGATQGMYQGRIVEFDLMNNHGYYTKSVVAGDKEDPVVIKFTAEDEMVL